MSAITRRQRVDLACAVALGIALTAGVSLGIGNLTSSEAVAPTPTVTVTAQPVVTTKIVHDLPECAEEDSRNCIWHADKSGNGEGTTFVDIDGVAYYAEAPVDPPLVGDVIDGQRVTSVDPDGSFTTEPATWHGFTTGEVIVCAPGLEVAPDVRADGTAWAACM